MNRTIPILPSTQHIRHPPKLSSPPPHLPIPLQPPQMPNEPNTNIFKYNHIYNNNLTTHDGQIKNLTMPINPVMNTAKTNPKPNKPNRTKNHPNLNCECGLETLKK